MFLLDKEKILDSSTIGKIINKFNTSVRPTLQKYWDYYNGKQAILNKKATDTGKPCNKIVVNYCNSIVNNFLGYIAGIPVSYSNEDFDDVLAILKYNDVVNEDTELLRNALIFGMSFEINYVDENGKQRFKVLDSRECIPVYDNTLNNELLYVIRFYEEDLISEQIEQKYIVEVYGKETVKRYRSDSGFSSFELLEERPHFFAQVPVTVFSLNKDEDSVFKQVITLQDSYNQLLSDSVDDFQAFCDSYLVLKGCVADDDDLESMKQNRVLMLDPDSSAEYLTKSISDTQIQNLLSGVNDKIHKIANCPDLNDENFAAQTGIALRLKLVGFENAAASIESYMRKALTKRIELISEILKLTDIERVWRDVNITFTRNLPFDLTEAVNTVNMLRGIVSTKTLLSLLPFVKDVDKEMEEVQKEKEANMSLYSFGMEEEEDLSIQKSAEGKLKDE